MAKKKDEQIEAEDMAYHRHPDGRLEEMTRSEADKLVKQQSADEKKADQINEAESKKDWKEEIKTR